MRCGNGGLRLERQTEKEMELMEPNFSDAPSFSVKHF